MQPESNEEREAANVLYVRRLIGIPDDKIDETVDALIRDALGRHHYYDQCADDVRERLGVPTLRTRVGAKPVSR